VIERFDRAILSMLPWTAGNQPTKLAGNNHTDLRIVPQTAPFVV